MVAGIRNTENLDDLGKHFPGVKDELIGIFARLEAHYRDMCDTEFTIEARQAVDAADPGGEAHRANNAAHGGRHDQPAAAGLEIRRARR